MTEIQEYHELIFTKDRIRQFSDIRNIPEKDLSSYQKTQLKDIKKYVYDLEMVELQKTIFRMFDRRKDTLYECLISHPQERPILEMN